jgi:hypothetical protein
VRLPAWSLHSNRVPHAHRAPACSAPAVLGSDSIEQVLRFPNFQQAGPTTEISRGKEQVGRRFENKMGRIALTFTDGKDLSAFVGATLPSRIPEQSMDSRIPEQSMACTTACRLSVPPSAQRGVH